MKFFKNNLPVFILLILALGTRFLFLSFPAEVVFDEVHFGKFVSAYFTHQYYFDIHPPLGKLLIAGFASLFGFQGNFDFGNIGETYNSYNLFILRFLPAFFSALFVILIYYLVLALGLSKKAAFLAGFFVLFENAILGQSKFILVDIFLLFFGFASLLLFFLARRNLDRGGLKQFLYITLSAVFAGLAFSVKWTGFSFWAIIMLLLFLDFINNARFKDYFAKILIFIFLPLLVYVLIFAIHFNLLKKSGPGNAFMTPAFQKTLADNNITNNIKPLSFSGKFFELNKAMYRYNASITASHPYASRWYQWPFGQKPIWYWNKTTDQAKSNIYLFPNLAVFWLSFISVMTSVFLLFVRKYRKKIFGLIYLLLFAYFLNLLPFILVSRVTFLYHYLASLIFGIIIFALLADKFVFAQEPQKTEKPYKKQETKKSQFNWPLYAGILIFVFSIFLFLAPLTYGLPISFENYKFYEWLLKFFL